MIKKYRIVELVKPIHCYSRIRQSIKKYKYSLQQQQHFLGFKWWKSIEFYQTFEQAKEAVIERKKKDATNWKDIVVWSE